MFAAELTLPYPARLGIHHRRRLLATEAFGKLRQILEHGVGAVLVGRVGITLRLGAQLLGARLRAPLLRVCDQETLLRRVAVHGGGHVHIGHELTHGFDDEGRQFDKDGNLSDWWTKEDESKFKDRADCMVRQYDAIEAVPGVHLNGKLTLGENLADLGGLWLAWIAWLDKAQAAHVDMSATMDGYTPDQRFWIAYAQQWCTQTRPEQLRTQAQSNPHAPDEYRTNTVLQDLPEFAKSFSCKKTAAMVNPKPCRVW